MLLAACGLPVMDQHEDALLTCKDCDLFQLAPTTPPGVTLVIVCRRCGSRLRKRQHNSATLALACAVLGLLLLLIAALAPLASVSMRGGRFASSDVFTGPKLLWQTGAAELSVVVLLTLLVLPGLKLAAVLAMVLAPMFRPVPSWGKRLLAVQPRLGPWAMVDVFLLGAMIALARLGGWMPVDLGAALYALGGVALCLLGADWFLDHQTLWRRIEQPRLKHRPEGELRLCFGCGLVNGLAERERCPRCEKRLHLRKPHSINRCWAFIATATLVAVPANVLPVMTITQFGQGGPSTIVGGSIELVERGFWPLAVLVFVASIMIPLLKLVALAALLLMTTRASAWRLVLRTKLYRIVAWIGRWSMLDIFATMTLVMLARFGWVGSVFPEVGASAFCAVVVLTMLASEAFDPRLMWDAAGKNQRRLPPALESAERA